MVPDLIGKHRWLIMKLIPNQAQMVAITVDTRVVIYIGRFSNSLSPVWPKTARYNVKTRPLD